MGQMRLKRRVSDDVREELIDQALEKMRVALKARNPAWEQCSSIIAEFIARTNVNANQLLSNATIHEIGLEVRYADMLYNLGFVTVRALAGTTESELRQIPGIGVNTVEQCRRALRRLNMSFKDEVPNLLSHPPIPSFTEMEDD